MIYFYVFLPLRNSCDKTMPKKNAPSPRIDVHGLKVEDALYDIGEFIARQPHGVEKIVVVHGYNNGTALKDAVKRRLHSPRILEIAPSFLNPGETVIYLKR